MKKFLKNLLVVTLVVIIANSFCCENESTNSTSSSDISTYSDRDKFNNSSTY